MLFLLVTKQACDGRTGRQNYDPRYHANVAALRGKNDVIAGAPAECGRPRHSAVDRQRRQLAASKLRRP